MKFRASTLRLAGLGLAAMFLFAPAAPATGQVRIEITPPSVRFEVRPPLVVVSPGIEVVPDYDREVFVVGGLWWTFHDGYWYRSRSHHDRWVRVAPARVPVRLRELPRGKYRHWKAHKADAKVRRDRAKARDKRAKARRKAAKKRRHGGKGGHDAHRGYGGHGGGHHKHKKGKGK